MNDELAAPKGVRAVPRPPENAQLEKRVAELEKRVADLEQRLGVSERPYDPFRPYPGEGP
jgi:uncharacterized protein YceH (UPF0502 family)